MNLNIENYNDSFFSNYDDSIISISSSNDVLNSNEKNCNKTTPNCIYSVLKRKVFYFYIYLVRY